VRGEKITTDTTRDKTINLSRVTSAVQQWSTIGLCRGGVIDFDNPSLRDMVAVNKLSEAEREDWSPRTRTLSKK